MEHLTGEADIGCTMPSSTPTGRWIGDQGHGPLSQEVQPDPEPSAMGDRPSMTVPRQGYAVSPAWSTESRNSQVSAAPVCFAGE